ncbi:TPA: ATP-dependent helicase [Vibrio vulnificus]|uniref:DNA 3'-5' helicase n=1 Tax=Vibrio vulnificus TaxID=672 RepID=A0A8H9TFP8_VIBVL|nr:ATP-dependent helicase [Vibrio vulnificus]HAS8540999.1 ATP-dependent helicase [Vibrio vulnificus]
MLKEAFSKLNLPQKEAVLSDNIRLLILAGAGSGKTSTITVRVAKHIAKDKLHPEQILGLTFTNKAAGELKSRVAKLVGESHARHLFMGTFHSFAMRFLRKNYEAAGLSESFQVLDPNDANALLKSLLRNEYENQVSKAKSAATASGLPQEELDDILESTKEALDFKLKLIKPAITNLSRAKNLNLNAYAVKEICLINDGLAPQDCEMCQKLAVKYEEEKRRLGMLDFDDLIIETNRAFEKNPSLRTLFRQRFKAIIVDEYQDTNIPQAIMLQHIVASDCMLSCVGDDDQIIYSWRGAVIDNIIGFSKRDETKVIRLEQNYRSTRNIIEGTNALISNNKNRLGKKLFTASESGELIEENFYYSATSEAVEVAKEIHRLIHNDKVSPTEIAVLYRKRSMSSLIETELHRLGVSNIIFGGIGYWERSEIKDCIAFAKWIGGMSNPIAINRVLKTLRIGFGDKKNIEVESIAKEQNVTYIEAISIYANQGAESQLKKKMKLLLNIIDSGRTLYANEGLGRLIEHIVHATGLLPIHEKYQEKEKYDEIVDNMLYLVEIAKNFDHEMENATGDRLDDLVAFISSGDLQAEATHKRNDNKDSVSLMTIHSSKGLEFPYVFVIGVEEGHFPASQKTSEKEIEEERRLAYVAFTRAMKKLTVSATRHRMGKPTEGKSRFLDEIPQKVKKQTDHTVHSGGYRRAIF